MQVFTDLTALIVSQCQEDVDRLADHLRRAGFYIFLVRVDSEDGFSKALDPRYDIILADLTVPDMDVHHLTQILQERGINIPLILLCDPSQEELAIDCLRLGASDYLCNDRLSRLGMAVGRAIENRLRNEQVYYEEERDYKLVFEHSRDTILLVRLADGQILEANRAAELAYGYTHNELLNLHITDLRAPETHGAIIEQLQRASQTGILFETQHKRKNGQVFSVEVSSTGTELAGQRVILSIIRDITERRSAEDQIRRLARLPEESPNPVAQVHVDGTILYSNAAGKTVLMSYIQEGTNQVKEDIRVSLGEIYSRGEIYEHEQRVNDQFYWIMLTPIVGVDYVNVYGREITQKKLAEEKTNQQVKQLSALRAIDRSILSSRNLEETLDVVLGKIIDLLDVDAAEVLLYEPESKTIKSACLKGLEKSPEHERTVEMGQSHGGRVALERRMEFIPDLKQVEDSLTVGIRSIGEEFTSYLALPLICRGELKGALQLFHREQLAPETEWLGFLQALADQAAIAIDNAQLFDEQMNANQRLAEAYDKTIMGWSRALDLRDHDTEGHSQRVTEMTETLARSMGVSDDEMTFVRWGAMLHDIGKMGVPDQVLHKPGALNEREWEVMRRHPTFAYELLNPIDFLRAALDIPYYHHESWDGLGYPWGLKGEDIPLIARIFAVVDSWDALLSDRPYRKGWEPERALAYIREQAGRQFDPAVVEDFVRLVACGAIPVTQGEYFDGERLALIGDHLANPKAAVFHQA